MKKSIVMVLGLLAGMSAFAGPGDVGSVGKRPMEKFSGSNCTVKKGSQKISGVYESKNEYILNAYKTITIFGAKSLTSGLLTPIANNSLEFKPENTKATIVSSSKDKVIDGNAEYYDTIQTLELFDSKNNQIKSENNLPVDEEIKLVYKHKFQWVNPQHKDSTKQVTITIIDKMITDHVSPYSAKLEIKTTGGFVNKGNSNPDGSSILEPVNYTMTADLICKNEVR